MSKMSKSMKEHNHIEIGFEEDKDPLDEVRDESQSRMNELNNNKFFNAISLSSTDSRQQSN